MKTKKVYCSYDECGSRRKHWALPYEPRGQQVIEIPKEHIGPYYCSFECACMAGVMCMDVSQKPRFNWVDLPDAKRVGPEYYINKLIRFLKRYMTCDGD